MAEAAAIPQHPQFARLIRLIAAAVGACIMLILAAWEIPRLLDWSRYRGAIATFSAAELGRPVKIGGPISVMLLPEPLVEAEDVELGDGGDGIALSAPSMRLRLRLLPLLIGRVEPRELVLSGAAITLPWPLVLPSRGHRAGWLGAARARVEHGELHLGALRLTDFEADLASDPAEPGGLAVSGSGHWLDRAWQLEGHFGGPDPDGAVPLQLGVELQHDPATAPTAGLQFTGAIEADHALAGRINLHTADFSRFAAVPAMPLAVEGQVKFRGGPVQAQLAVSLGGTQLTAMLRPDPADGAQEMELAIGTLELDPWLRPAPRRRNPAQIVKLAPLPWPLSLDVSASAARLRGALLRSVHAAVRVDSAGTVIQAASAVLPGEAQLKLHGRLNTAATVSLAGRWDLDAPQLHTTLAWLSDCGLRLGPLPPEVLREATLSGSVSADRDVIAVDELHGTLEQSNLGGRVSVETASGAITADVTLDRLDADAWLQTGASLDWPRISGALGGFALALKLHATELHLRDAVLRQAAIDIATDAGGVALAGADFDLDGLHGHLAGTIGGDGQVTGGELDLSSPQATAFARYLPSWARGTDFLWAGPLRLHAEANGPLSALITSLSIDLFDARLDAHPLINLATGAWSTQFTLRHPGAPRLLAALGFADARYWLGEGSLSMLAQASGEPGVMRLDNFDLTAANLHTTGDAIWTSGAAGPGTLHGHLNADTLPLPGASAHDTTPLPVGWLSATNVDLEVNAGLVLVGNVELLRDAHVGVHAGGGMLRLDPVKASLAGGTLTGTASLNATSVPPRLSVQAQLARAQLDAPLFGSKLDLDSGQLDASINVAGNGYSPSALLASLSGLVRVQAAAGSIGGIDLAATADHSAADTALTQGATRFDALQLSATLDNGTATLSQATLAGPDGNAQISGTVDLPGSALDVLARLSQGDFLRLSGSVGAPRGSTGKPDGLK